MDHATDDVLSRIELAIGNLRDCGKQPATTTEAGVESGIKARSVKATEAGGSKPGPKPPPKPVGLKPGSMSGA